MKAFRIGIGALVIATAAYASAGQAATGQAGSKGSERSEAQTAGDQGSHRTNSSTTKSAAARERTASGTVKAIDVKALTLTNGEQFRLGHNTEYMRAGKKVSRQDIKQGEHVRASYEPRGNLAYAERIEIGSGKHSTQSGENTSSPGGK